MVWQKEHSITDSFKLEKTLSLFYSNAFCFMGETRSQMVTFGPLLTTQNPEVESYFTFSETTGTSHNVREPCY